MLLRRLDTDDPGFAGVGTVLHLALIYQELQVLGEPMVQVLAER